MKTNACHFEVGTTRLGHVNVDIFGLPLLVRDCRHWQLKTFTVTSSKLFEMQSVSSITVDVIGEVYPNSSSQDPVCLHLLPLFKLKINLSIA